jgi:hypothetical protein
MVGSRPFQKPNICDHLGSHPNRTLHLLGSEALTPPAGDRFGKIDERASRRSQVLESLPAESKTTSEPLTARRDPEVHRGRFADDDLRIDFSQNLDMSAQHEIVER